jgi:hypothetical protein
VPIGVWPTFSLSPVESYVYRGRTSVVNNNNNKKGESKVELEGSPGKVKWTRIANNPINYTARP